MVCCEQPLYHKETYVVADGSHNHCQTIRQAHTIDFNSLPST